ncbi:MAG: helix-hairpin-helix domain-containing protein, partial [Candidatus Lokiarchaeota archaeon]
MTNIFDQILSQRHTYDFHLAHEMAEQAIDTQDYGQSLRICQKALTKANEQNVPTWISLFEDLAAKVKQKLETMQNSKEFTNAKYSNPNSTPVDDLSILSGVGPTIAQKLSNAGYLTVEQLFNAKPNELAKINGIGVESAGRIIQSAKKYFSGSIRKSHETLGKVSELNNTDCLKSEKQHNIINSLDSKAPKQLETKETNEIPQISSVSSGTPKCDIILESRISHDDVKSKNIEQDYQV